jgi:basic amino acid/polyamine antiporter, APA family
MVLIKIGILVLFIVLGLTGWNSNNLADFAPFGFGGVTAAAGIIFFSYIKIDAVSTAGEQVKNPHRSMPIAIITALLIVTALYVLVSLTAVAAQPHDQFQNQEAGLAAILEKVTGSFWSASLLAAGAVISIFSVTLVVIYGRTRILFAMARDGMLPELFHRVNPRTHTPVPNTLIVVTIIAVFTGFIAINFLGEMNGVENLVAFAIFSIAVIVLWRRESDLPRPFTVPAGPDPVRPRLAFDHQGLADRHADRVRDLRCDRDRLVFPVRHQALPPRPARACRVDQGRTGGLTTTGPLLPAVEPPRSRGRRTRARFAPRRD